MEKWFPILITAVLSISTNQQSNYGCSYETLLSDDKQITCLNVTSAFFQYSGINLSRSHWFTCKNCNLSTIANDTFNFPKNTINYLFLTENNVMNLGTLAFSKLPLLKVLNLRGNLLTALQAGGFFGIKRLLQLDLSRNLLAGLDEGVFLELENLDILNLNDNRISSIDPEAFGGLMNLKYLYLNQNDLEALKGNMFKNLPNLKMLYLENNRIYEIHPLAFNKLYNLNYLYLNSNNISYLTQYNFKPLSNLIDLQLRFNNLTVLETSTFNGLKNIKFLYLGQNNLKNVRPYAFIGLNTLEVLDLIGNKFEYFSLDYFKDMDNLNALWLENNNISNFTIQYHTYKQEAVKVLNLIENRLELFNYRLLHEKLPQLEELWIGDNPWKCDFVIEMNDYFVNNNVSVCTSTNCTPSAVRFYIQRICFEPFQNETELTTDFVIDSANGNSLSDLLLVVLPLLIFYEYFVISTSF